jgi:hypothetical protein
VTLLTDFGPHSEHVGALHAVLVAANPRLIRVDLAHDIPAGDVRFGAVVLARLSAHLPRAVHLAVVDPGVGSARRGIAIRLAGGGALVGPDNGLLGLAARAHGPLEVVVLPSTTTDAATFDGRDVFAPAAAHLATGGDLRDLGAPVDLQGIHVPEIAPANVRRGVLRAEILGCDRFGNIQLAASAEDAAMAGLAIGQAVELTGPATDARARVGRTFADVAVGGLLVYVDSHGHLAVAENRGDAARRLGTRAGESLTIAGTPTPTS